MDTLKRLGATLAALLVLATGAVWAVDDQNPPARPDGFGKLLAAREQRDQPAAAQPEPKATPAAAERRIYSMRAPMWSVIRAYYGPEGDLRWGCSIEARPLMDPDDNRIPD